MKEHFDNHIKLHRIILERKPKVIVECGAGEGESTRLIAGLQYHYSFDFYSISDKEITDIPGVKWKVGLSYKRLPEFPDNSIDLCIIDTDHNYWTLTKELEAVASKITEGGLLIFHDVEEFYHNTGMAMSYWNDEPYPKEEIMECAKFGGVGDALLNFVVKRSNQWKLVRWVQENHGAAIIEKHTITHTKVVTPAMAPLFAKPYHPPEEKPLGVLG